MISPMPARSPEPVPPSLTPGRRAYLIGIGGCGMSGLARMLRGRGIAVSGSDMAPSSVTDALVAEGIAVTFDQQAGAVPDGVDLVVASAAIKPDHPELVAATHRGIEILTYAEALGAAMVGRTGVAVAGTHGKSTTVGMLGHALICAGLDPTVIVGAVSSHLSAPGMPPSGFRLGSDRVPIGPRAGEPGVVVAEACEFNRSFHALYPRLAAITSVEADHLDIYGSLDAVVQSFAEFAARVPSAAEGGRLLIAHEGAHRREVASATTAEVQTIGFNPSADWHVTYDASTHRVGLNHKGRHLGNWTLQLPGEHMAFDSAVAATLATWLGADIARVSEALAGFRGIDRRMQLVERVRIGNVEPAVPVYDDYGHHPTEIDVTLRALREHEKPEKRGGRLICVFQPHQHSRTRFLLDEFAAAFGQADIVIVPHIYFVRDSEVEKTRVSAADLVDRLRAKGVQAMHLYPFDAIVEQLLTIVRPGDAVVVMGAGPVFEVAYGFVGRASARDGSGRVRSATA